MRGTAEHDGVLARAVLDSVSGLIVAIDSKGQILEVNQAWRRYMTSRPAQPEPCPQGNYFDLCRWWGHPDAEQSAELIAGIESVLRGKAVYFEAMLRDFGAQDQPLFAVRATPLPCNGTGGAAIAHNEITQVHKLLVRASERGRRRRASQRHRWTRFLDHLATPPSTGITASVFGLAPLRISAPQEFQRLTETYVSLLELALTYRTYRMDGSLTARLRLLAEELGSAAARPRDLIDLHKAAFRHKADSTPPAKLPVLLEEGRLVLLELMGFLASYYRESSSVHWSGRPDPAAEEGTEK